MYNGGRKTGLRVELPENCECGFENLKIWGSRIDRRVGIEVRCMRCGKVLWEIEEQDGG